MTSRAIWKGNIHFGVVDVPVKRHPAVKEERITFHLLHRRDLTKLKQLTVCAHERVPVPAEEQVRGFEWGEGKYLFIDRVSLERVYYLEPDEHATGYQALVQKNVSPRGSHNRSSGRYRPGLRNFQGLAT